MENGVRRAPAFSILDSRFSSWLHRVAVATACATGVLIVAGGLVTSKEVGMAVPDWPTTFGYNMFAYPPSKWLGGVFYEHVHRLLGSGVGMLTLALALGIWLVDGRRWLRVLGIVAIVAVIAQGVLGGLRVTLVSAGLAIPHACLAQAFFALLVSIVVFTSRRWRSVEPAVESNTGVSLRWVCVAVTVAVYVQTIFGALVRHAAAVAGPALHAHLAGAVALTACVAWLAVRLFRDPAGDAARAGVTGPGQVVLALFVVQVGLGFGSLLVRMMFEGVATPTWIEVGFTTAHVVAGAFLLAASVVATLRAFRGLTPPATQATGLEGNRTRRPQAV